MSAREGSVWIEDDSFCYIDENGDKNCLDFSEVRERLLEVESAVENVGGLEGTDGSGEKGIIFHSSSGETINGVQVDANNWVEIYGNEIHFSQT